MLCNCDRSQVDNKQEVIIKDFHTMVASKRINNHNRQDFMKILQDVKHFTMMKPSRYEQYKNLCIKQKTQFEDQEFPPNQKNIGLTINHRKIIWKRVTQIIKDPVLVDGIIQPSDVQQGNIGDCYFLASISSIAQNSERIRKIFCDELQTSKEGIYRLQVACQGIFQEIVIDDYIPVFEGSLRPVFCKPKNNQIWVMLLEKAWAKIRGSYANTSAGYPHEVLNTFLQAPCYYYEIPFRLVNSQKQKQALWSKIIEADHKNWIMCAGSRQTNLNEGIKPAHTYSLLGCYEVPSKDNQNSTKIIKLRNPWGDTQFVGKYSENDQQFWNNVDPMLKLAIFKKRNQNDGIFTIQIQDFLKNYESIDISHYHQDYNYIFEKINAKSSQPFFLDFLVTKQTEKCELYITIEKEFNRNALIKQKNNQYGYSRLVVARVEEIQMEGRKPKHKYHYITSKLETNFPDLTVNHKFDVGRYVIYGQTFFPGHNHGQVTISIYGKVQMYLTQTNHHSKKFLRKVFTTHASLNTDNRVYIENNQDQWTNSKFLFNEGGYGYILAHVGENKTKSSKIQLDLKKIYDGGFIVRERKVEEKHEGIKQIQIMPGQQKIVVFQVNFDKDYQQLKFPPKGVKVVRSV